MRTLTEIAACIPEHFLLAAIDGGGTKTECALVGEDGTTLGVGRGGPSRVAYVGPDRSAESVRLAVEGAVSAARKPDLPVAMAVCTHRLAETAQVEEMIGDLLQTEVLNVSEADAVFGGAGLTARHGVAHVGGTGVTAWAFRSGQLVATVNGWGMVLGDEGGGYDMAVRGLRAAVRSLDGRGPHTRLYEDILMHFQVPGEREALLRGLATVTDRHVIASFSRCVTDAARSGDTVACSVVAQSVTEQSLSILTAARAAFDSPEAFPVALNGGVVCDTTIVEGLRELVLSEFARAEILLPVYSPAVGLALLTLGDLLKAAGRR